MMNLKHILVILIVAGLNSCTTAYNIGQTPDDVYYSPAPPSEIYVQTDSEEDRYAYNNASPEDRDIRRSIRNPRMRRLYAGYDANVYNYNYPNSYYPYANSYSPYESSYYPYSNNYYPYASGYYPYSYGYPVYAGVKPNTLPTFTGPRKYNLGAYTSRPVTNYTLAPRTGRTTPAPNVSTTNASGNPARTFAKPNNGSGMGNFLRKVLSTPNTNYGTNSSDNGTQSRSFEPSSRSSNTSSVSGPVRSSSSSSSSSSSNAPVRTFKK